ncbi:hypothetical protein DL93DRAFT_2091809 [Clavulina sp. PMI_390]|nr:hypothetical protein DL93DRAFT_2091809 [Clavulina sp. PMI_390]
MWLVNTIFLIIHDQINLKSPSSGWVDLIIATVFWFFCTQDVRGPSFFRRLLLRSGVQCAEFQPPPKAIILLQWLRRASSQPDTVIRVLPTIDPCLHSFASWRDSIGHTFSAQLDGTLGPRFLGGFEVPDSVYTVAFGVLLFCRRFQTPGRKLRQRRSYTSLVIRIGLALHAGVYLYCAWAKIGWAYYTKIEVWTAIGTAILCETVTHVLASVLPWALRRVARFMNM